MRKVLLLDNFIITRANLAPKVCVGYQLYSARIVHGTYINANVIIYASAQQRSLCVYIADEYIPCLETYQDRDIK